MAVLTALIQLDIRQYGLPLVTFTFQTAMPPPQLGGGTTARQREGHI